MAENFMISYPDNGSKGSITYGLSFLDFQNGTFIDPAGTKTTLKRSLGSSKQEYIRSIAIFCSDTAIVRFGTGKGVKSMVSSYGWNIFENINIRELEIETFTAGVPDTQEILIIGSTSSKSIYNPNDLIQHQQDKSALTTSANAYVTHFYKVTDKFLHNTFVVNEDGTNSVTYRVMGKQTGTATAVEIQAATVLSASTDIVQIEGAWSILYIEVKSTVAATHGKSLISWSGLS